MSLKQLFFSKEERDEAFAAAEQCNEELFDVIDRRSKNPSPRMYVLTRSAMEQMIATKMPKRMWIFRQQHVRPKE